ncbi:hypothetical protein [Paracoccus yeei]|uniref:hypothetical protein n=1 Tax=Paracoccus yeei TaxID=147645 RepID=UPI0011B04A95|nr:hypothetical protein [Paracoccus yeei]
MIKEYIVQTPTGARVLTDLGDLVTVRNAFAPADPYDCAKRLMFHPTLSKKLHFAADGIWLNSKLLWSLVLAYPGCGRQAKLKDAINALFYQNFDGHKALMNLFSKYDPNEKYWDVITRFGWYDANTGVIHNTAKRR